MSSGLGTAEIIGIATAIVLTLCGVIAKLYRSHKIDLRRAAGLPTHSDEPPPTKRERPRPPPPPTRRR